MEGVFDAIGLFGNAFELDRHNVGGVYDPKTGQYTRFGRAGEPDVQGHVRRGPNAGRRIAIECKRGGFDPATATGSDRERFDGQVAWLRRLIADGGLGMWVNSPDQAAHALRRILEGWRTEIDGEGYPWVTNDPL